MAVRRHHALPHSHTYQIRSRIPLLYHVPFVHLSTEDDHLLAIQRRAVCGGADRIDHEHLGLPRTHDPRRRSAHIIPIAPVAPLVPQLP
jgi:hypothetical protein